MKKIIILVLVVCAATLAQGQGFPGTDSLRTYNNKYITTNPATAFTNNRLHTLIRGIIDWVDTARAGTGGGGAVGMDTLWTINDSTIRYRRNGSFQNHILKGVYDTRRKVDTAYALNDSTLQIKINGTNRNIILPGRHWDLQGILNNGSTLTENENIVLADSLQFTSGAVVIETLRIRGITNSIDTTTYKPVAVGPNGATVKLDGWPDTPFSLSNVGTGFAWATTPNGSIKTAIPGDGTLIDSASTTLTIRRDTTGANGSVTRSELKDTTNSLRRKISDSLVFALKSILIPSRLEFIEDSDTAIYQNDDLIGSQIMMLSIESYQVGFTVRATSVYMSFDSNTGTITLTNGQFASGDQVIIIYRTPPVFLLDGSGNPVRDGSGNFIILN